jgi:hypothetical protein
MKKNLCVQPRSVPLPATFQTFRPPYPPTVPISEVGVAETAERISRELGASVRLALYIRFAPIATELMRCRELTRCARTGCEQSQQRGSYSITASARAMSIGGTSRPSALALRRLMINSKCVGCSTGRSEGLLPLRILSTKYAHRTNELGKLGP